MAEFIEVMKQKKRMCESLIEKYSSSCKNCGLSSCNNHGNLGCQKFTSDFPEESEKIIMDWAKEHPVVTNRDKFKEIFGDTVAGSISLTGCSDFICDIEDCAYCDFNDFWEQEYIEPKERKNG